MSGRGADDCCEISRRLSADRGSRIAAEKKAHEAEQERNAIRAQLRATQEERDDWRMRAQTLAITYPDHFTPSYVELAEWRVLGQRLLRESVRWDDMGDYKAHWSCQQCYVDSCEVECPEPYPHDANEACGRAQTLLGAAPGQPGPAEPGRG